MACSDIWPTTGNTVSRSPFVAAVASAKSPKQAMAGQTHALSRAEFAAVAAIVQIPLDRWGQCASKGSIATGNAMQGPLTAAIGESMLLVAACTDR